MGHYGVDLSSNNAHPIAWGALYAHLSAMGGEQPFAIIKATEGVNYVNPDFAADVQAAKAIGFAVGAYLMDHGSADPASEEAAFKRIAGGLPQFDDDELPDGLSPAAYAAHLHLLIAQGLVVQYLNQSEVATGYPQGAGLWLAQYNNDPGVTAYPALIHQFTSSATVPGCAGQFDLNYFCGSEAQFDALFLQVPPAPPTGKVPSMFYTDPVTGLVVATDANGNIYARPGAIPHVVTLGEHPEWHAGNAESWASNPCVGIVAEKDVAGTWGYTFITQPANGQGSFGPYQTYHINRDGSF